MILIFSSKMPFTFYEQKIYTTITKKHKLPTKFDCNNGAGFSAKNISVACLLNMLFLNCSGGNSILFRNLERSRIS